MLRKSRTSLAAKPAKPAKPAKTIHASQASQAKHQYDDFICDSRELNSSSSDKRYRLSLSQHS